MRRNHYNKGTFRLTILKLKTDVMNKKQFTQFMNSHGGEIRYSGNNRVMYVHKLSKEKQDELFKKMVDSEMKLDFRVLFQ